MLEAAAASTSPTACGPASSSRRPSSCSTRVPALGERLRPRGARPPRHRAPLRRRLATASRSPSSPGRSIWIYGQQEVVKDLIDGAARGERRRALRGLGRRLDGIDGDEADAPLPARGRGPRARLRLRRRLRRLPRHLARRDPARRRCASTRATTRSRGSAVLADVAPSTRGADLRVARARLRAPQPALAQHQPALPAGRARRGPRRLARRADLAGAAASARPATA